MRTKVTMRSISLILLAFLNACDDGPDEWTCVIPKGGVSVCVDVLQGNGESVCETDLGGAAAVVEEPGSYTYCADLGYTQDCAGTVGEGEQYSAMSAEDCTAADGS
jgi:hypothetical protein